MIGVKRPKIYLIAVKIETFYPLVVNRVKKKKLTVKKLFPRFLKVTVDISMGKIILEVKYLKL